LLGLYEKLKNKVDKSGKYRKQKKKPAQ